MLSLCTCGFSVETTLVRGEFGNGHQLAQAGEQRMKRVRKRGTAAAGRGNEGGGRCKRYVPWTSRYRTQWSMSVSRTTKKATIEQAPAGDTLVSCAANKNQVITPEFREPPRRINHLHRREYTNANAGIPAERLRTAYVTITPTTIAKLHGDSETTVRSPQSPGNEHHFRIRGVGKQKLFTPSWRTRRIKQAQSDLVASIVKTIGWDGPCLPEERWTHSR